MPWKASVLVVANRTADSDELAAALAERAARSPTSFTLVVPATLFDARSASTEAGLAGARRQLEAALGRLREAGLEVDGSVGDADPMAAIADVWDPGSFDEIVVSTLPTGASRWLAADLPRRVARLTGAPVDHVVARELRPAPEATSRPPKRRDWTALFRTAPRDRVRS